MGNSLLHGQKSKTQSLNASVAIARTKLRISAKESDVFWLQRNKELQDNPIYQYLNMTGKGRLIDVYKRSGETAVARIIRTEIVKYLYNEGKGEFITISEIKDVATQSNKSEYWASQPTKKGSSLTMDAATFSWVYDGESCPDIVEVCWNIDQRGINGENLLHLACMNKTPEHRAIVKILLTVFPKLARDSFISEEYYGQNALHLAIVNRDLELAHLLVKCGADVTQKATGSFFLPADPEFYALDKVENSHEKRNKGFAYYGEHPLAFAACMGDQDMYNFLIDCGGDPDLTDSFGNTVLHMVVIHNRMEIYRFAVLHITKPANSSLSNKDGLTPVALSAKLGRRDVFKEILNLNTVELWKYGNITCTVYPLTALDTISPGGRTDWASALMFIINGTSDEHLDMVEGVVVSQILEEKWRTYARRRFIERFLLSMFQLLIVGIAVYLRPSDNKRVSFGDFAYKNDHQGDNTEFYFLTVFRYILEMITFLNSSAALFMTVDEIREQGIVDFLKGLRHAPPKAGYLIASICFVLCVPLRIIQLAIPGNSTVVTNSILAEESLLIVAVPLTWMYLLFFAGGIMLTGPFVTMIYRMIKGDMVRFGIIYCISVLCFAQAYYFLFKNVTQTSITTFNTPLGTVMTLFKMTLGEIKYNEFHYTNHYLLTNIIFAMFMVFVPILLLNMLIAMMGNTYQLVISRSQKEWTSMWAKIVIILERTYSTSQLLKFQDEYSMPFPKNPDVRGLVVIYRTESTLAQNRNTSKIHWKLFYSKILKLIKDYRNEGNTGEFNFDGSDASKATIRRRRQRAIAAAKRKGPDPVMMSKLFKRLETLNITATFVKLPAQLAHAHEQTQSYSLAQAGVSTTSTFFTPMKNIPSIYSEPVNRTNSPHYPVTAPKAIGYTQLVDQSDKDSGSSHTTNTTRLSSPPHYDTLSQDSIDNTEEATRRIIDPNIRLPPGPKKALKINIDPDFQSDLED